MQLAKSEATGKRTAAVLRDVRFYEGELKDVDKKVSDIKIKIRDLN